MNKVERGNQTKMNKPGKLNMGNLNFILKHKCLYKVLAKIEANSDDVKLLDTLFKQVEVYEDIFFNLLHVGDLFYDL